MAVMRVRNEAERRRRHAAARRRHERYLDRLGREAEEGILAGRSETPDHPLRGPESLCTGLAAVRALRPGPDRDHQTVEPPEGSSFYQAHLKARNREESGSPVSHRRIEAGGNSRTAADP